MTPTATFVDYAHLTWPAVAALPRMTPLCIPVGEGYAQKQIAAALGNPSVRSMAASGSTPRLPKRSTTLPRYTNSTAGANNGATPATDCRTVCVQLAKMERG